MTYDFGIGVVLTVMTFAVAGAATAAPPTATPSPDRPTAGAISRTMSELLPLLDLFRFDVFNAFVVYLEALSLSVTKIPNGLECRVGDEKVVAMKRLPTADEKGIVAAPSVGYSFPVSRAR